MQLNPALLSPLSLLLGAIIGATASLLATIYTQRHQDRIQRVASEVAKRETVYADFVMIASSLIASAYIQDAPHLGSDEQRLIGLMNRMRLFAPPAVSAEAELVLRTIVEISLQPKVEVQQLAKAALLNHLDPDPLLKFSSVCRADLDSVRQSMM
jgi:multisubunit Na+/H+ antiporter MnhG subunit